jgi:hypothetical protein
MTQTTTMLVSMLKCGGERNPNPLLKEMQISANNMESIMEVPQKKT